MSTYLYLSDGETNVRHRAVRLVAETELLPWFVERIWFHHGRRQRRRRHRYRTWRTHFLRSSIMISIIISARFDNVYFFTFIFNSHISLIVC